jgi:hypothetical protein
MVASAAAAAMAFELRLHRFLLLHRCCRYGISFRCVCFCCCIICRIYSDASALLFASFAALLVSAASAFVASSAAATIAFDSAASAFVLASFAAFGWLRLLLCGCIGCCPLLAIAFASAASALLSHPPLLLLRLIRLNLLLYPRVVCCICFGCIGFVASAAAAAIAFDSAASAFVVASAAAAAIAFDSAASACCCIICALRYGISFRCICFCCCVVCRIWLRLHLLLRQSAAAILRLIELRLW